MRGAKSWTQPLEDHSSELSLMQHCSWHTHCHSYCPLCWPQPSLVHAHDVGLVNYFEYHIGVTFLNCFCMHAFGVLAQERTLS